MEVVKVVLVLWSLIWATSWAQERAADPTVHATPAGTPTEGHRIAGVIPDYETVPEGPTNVEPLTVKEKYALFARQTLDPFTLVMAAAGAGLSQAANSDPKYGQGGGPYAQRFGAAVADISSARFFGGAVLPSLLHEDPRYFREGPSFGFWHRLGHCFARTVVTRTDDGRSTFNFAGIGGMAMGIALSNVYYPPASVNGAEIGRRFGTSLSASLLSNILPEFWPDIRSELFHRK